MCSLHQYQYLLVNCEAYVHFIVVVHIMYNVIPKFGDHASMIYEQGSLKLEIPNSLQFSASIGFQYR